jgi:predicted RNA-binding Zn ribbon-like protein
MSLVSNIHSADRFSKHRSSSYTGVVKRPPRYDLPRAAPGPLRIVQELVNSADVEHGREWLADPDTLCRWLVERGLLPADAAVTAADLRRIVNVRAALRSLLLENNGAVADPDARAALSESAQRARLTLVWDERRATLAPRAEGVDGAIGRILLVVHGAFQDGSWSRLKACRNCCWAFYDASRNRSASWCSMQLCGNRRKTRAYRSRRRATA